MPIIKFDGTPLSFEVNFDPRKQTGNIYNDAAKHFSLEPGTFYMVCNGKLLNEFSEFGADPSLPVSVVQRTFGGKGGFGSMLRAIGAQIEKTTNRDACRDLSGRRLRDINEEQRLKRWFAKQKQRDEEKAELKKKKLERLRQMCDGPALPKMEDKEYNKIRSEMSDSVFEAVDKGFEAPSTSASMVNKGNTPVEAASTSVSHTHEVVDEVAKPAQLESEGDRQKNVSPKQFKRKVPAFKKTMLDEDLDSDVSSSDESAGEETNTPKKIKLG